MVDAASVRLAEAEKTPTKIGVTEPLKTKPESGGLIVYFECEFEACKTPEQGITAATEAIGWSMKTITFKVGDPATLVGAMQQALQLKPDAVVIPSVPQAVWQNQIAAYKAAGVKIIPIFNTAKADDTVIGQLASDIPVSAANAVSDYVIAHSDASAKSLIVATPDVPSEVAFTDALNAAFKKNCPDCKSDTLNLTLAQFQGGTGTGAVVSALQRDPSIEFVVNANGPQLPGLNSALAAAGMKGKVKVVGYSGSTTEFQGVASGDYAAYTGVPYRYVGVLAVDILLRTQQDIAFEPDDGGAPVQLFTVDNKFKIDDAVNFAAPEDMDEQFAKLWLVN